MLSNRIFLSKTDNFDAHRKKNNEKLFNVNLLNKEYFSYKQNVKRNIVNQS